MWSPLILLLLFLAVSLIPIRRITIFWAVEPGLPHESWAITLRGRQDGVSHLVSEGRLYLVVQRERQSLLLVMGVETETWDVARIRTFRAAHPDLEPYWPDPSREDGGINPSIMR